MKINYTPEERAALDSILKNIGDIVNDVGGRETTITDRTPAEILGDPTTPEAVELEKIDAEGRARIRKFVERYQEIQSAAEARSFAAISGSPENILDAAREELPRLLEKQYRAQVIDAPANLIKYAVDNKLITIGPDGSRRLHYDFARQICVSGLKLHADALAEHPEKLKELERIIADALQVSDFVGPAPVEAVAPATSYKRPAWPDNTKYGIMRDGVNTTLILDPGQANKTIDGQMQLVFATEQNYNKISVPIFVTLSYEGATDGRPRKLTGYDNNILSAISTINYYWQQARPGDHCIISPDEIYRIMNGKSPGDRDARPSAKERARIQKSIDKMRFTRITMDISQEIRAGNFKFEDEQLKSGTVDSHYINAERWEAETTSGRKITKYRLLNEPIIYTYNREKNHIVFAPLEMLDTSGELSNAEFVPEFRLYLLEQVMLMKENRRHGNNRILISSIYEKTGIDPPENREIKHHDGDRRPDAAALATYQRKMRAADCDKFEGILTSWKKKGAIKGFKIVRQGGKKNGRKIAYDITLPAEASQIITQEKSV